MLTMNAGRYEVGVEDREGFVVVSGVLLDADGYVD